MNQLISITFVAMAFATGSFAQSEKPTTSQTTPAVNTERNPGAPIAGKNSFSQKQAKSRFQNAGYKNIRDLKLDSQGVWRASADKDGRPVGVSLDFQGNVTMAK